MNPESVFQYSQAAIQDIFHMAAQQPKLANYGCNNSEEQIGPLCICFAARQKKPDFGHFANRLSTSWQTENPPPTTPVCHHTESGRKLSFLATTFLLRSSVDKHMSEESSSSSETSRLSLLWLQLMGGGWRRASRRTSPRPSRGITCRRV